MSRVGGTRSEDHWCRFDYTCLCHANISPSFVRRRRNNSARWRKDQIKYICPKKNTLIVGCGGFSCAPAQKCCKVIFNRFLRQWMGRPDWTSPAKRRYSEFSQWITAPRPSLLLLLLILLVYAFLKYRARERVYWSVCYIYIYIYIYMCVCVCVHVYILLRLCGKQSVVHFPPHKYHRT
jgi:hypothetical protein